MGDSAQHRHVLIALLGSMSCLLSRAARCLGRAAGTLPRYVLYASYRLGEAGVGQQRVLPFRPSLLGARQFTAGGNHDVVQNAIDSHDVIVFASPTCPFCAIAIEALSEAKIDHKVVLTNDEYRKCLIARTGKGSVPSVWVKGTYVGGCNDGTEPWHGVVPMLKNGKLQEMLK